MLRRRALIVLLALAGAAVVLWRDGGGAGDERPGASRIARVVRVVDGDTILVRIGEREERVRYIGIDTPESIAPGEPVQCFAKAAAAANARLVAGRRVRLLGDVEARDRYGRLLAYVYRIDDRRFVNAELLADGYARPLRIAPNVRHAARFARLAADAERHGRGLWRACAA